MPTIVLHAVNAGNKIETIKLVREITGLGLAGAKEAVENVQQGNPYSITDIPDERISAVIKDLENIGCVVFREGSSPIPTTSELKSITADRTEYNLFGKPVTFNAAENRYLDLQCLEQAAFFKSAELFSQWYQDRKEIEAVLQQYLPFAQGMLEKLILRPLFQQLAEFEIYDISWETYIKECAKFSNMKRICQQIITQNDKITQRQSDEEAYRKNRKAGRSRWEGGGFGLSGALKGAAMAGMMNATTGIAHSMVNAAGNAGSALSAATSREQLYQAPETKGQLLEAIWGDMYLTVCRHIDLVNLRKDRWIENSFSEDRANALLENAKNILEKREELLTQAFRLCPWNDQLITYIFTNYPGSRTAAIAAAQRFSVDLSAQTEEILSKEYTDEARRSESEAQAAKARILALMQEFNITESQTLDGLETDCLRRLCQGYETADQATCEQFMEAIRKYDAKSALKEPLLQDLQKRIEEIWSAEDGEIFDNLYMQTDITDAKAVMDAISYVQSKGRTSSTQKYLDALKACTPKNIANARLYRRTNRYKLYLVLAVLSALLAAAAPSEWITTIGWIAAILLFVLARSMKKSWKLLSIDGTIIHPALELVQSDESKK